MHPLSISLIAIDGLHQRSAVVLLHEEYLGWVYAGLEPLLGLPGSAPRGLSVANDIDSAVNKVYCDFSPHGVFYLIEVNGELAGMGGLRRLSDSTAEIKRLYVRPAHRGQQLGAMLLGRLLSDAQGLGYTQVRLDSAPFMHSAHRLYKALGFVDCPAYEGTEAPLTLHSSWRFMGRAI
jgi:GNAT superfamily N-acetyltransferase